jgi:glutathione peroxidase
MAAPLNPRVVEAEGAAGAGILQELENRGGMMKQPALRSRTLLLGAALVTGMALWSVGGASTVATAFDEIAARALSTEGGILGTIYEIPVREIKGGDTTLEKYRGKVLLIVNVASRCGYTPQYAGLQKLYETYSSKGLVVLGFPANNFGGQEPGTEAEIVEFCTMRYQVTFPLFAKVSAKGNDIHPLYRYLTAKETNPGFDGPISWNFNKFLIDRTGKTVARFESSDAPASPRVVQAIEAALR